MLQRLSNDLRGWAEVELRGEGEEFLNRCGAENIPFWNAKPAAPGLWRCRVSGWRWKDVERLARETGSEARVARWGGTAGAAWRLRRRWGFWLGLVLCAALVAGLSHTVLRIEVSGNVKVPTGKILTQLRAQGVKIGTFTPGMDVRQVSHGVMLEIPELSWMALNWKGTVAEVTVREGRERPELLEESVPAKIVAKYGGIITKVQATSGEARVRRGDTVAAGDVLIDSWVDFVEPEYFEGDLGGMFVRATGKVWARTWHTLRVGIPLEQEEKRYTGRERRLVSLKFWDGEVKFYGKGSIPYEKYDKIVSYHRVSLPFGTELPVMVKVVTLKEYELTPAPVQREEAAEEGKAQLLRQLALRAAEGEIRRTDLQVEERSGVMLVTLMAECEQLIGVTAEEE